LRFNQSTGVVVVSLPPAIVLLFDGLLVADQQRAVTQALAAAASKERHALLLREQALSVAPRLQGCLQTLACRVELANQNEAPYVLVAQVLSGPQGGGPGPWQLRLQLIDASAGEVAAEVTPSCTSCSAEQAATMVSGALGPLLNQAGSRPRGSVEITTDGPGTEVFIAGQKVGTTPYRASRFVGDYPVELRRPGLPAYQTTLSVRAGQKAAIAVKAPAEPSEPEPPPEARRPAAGTTPERYELVRRPRPIWRLATGGALLGAGLLVGGFGVSGLSVDGQCDLEAPADVPCTQQYNTQVVGISLVSAGAALAVAGAVLLAVPGPRQRVRVAGLPRPGGGLLGLIGRF
jgi:hypothetical protein